MRLAWPIVTYISVIVSNCDSVSFLTFPMSTSPSFSATSSHYHGPSSYTLVDYSLVLLHSLGLLLYTILQRFAMVIKLDRLIPPPHSLHPVVRPSGKATFTIFSPFSVEKYFQFFSFTFSFKNFFIFFLSHPLFSVLQRMGFR